RTLFEASPDGLVVSENGTTYIDTNPSMCRMLGYERHEFIGLSAADMLATDDLKHIGPAWTTLTAGTDIHRELRFRRKDGSIFTADVSATSLPNNRILGIVRDVTDRNDAIAARSEAEERMRYTLESARVGIWDLNNVTGELRWSETLEAQYGLQTGTFPGTFEAFVARIHPDDLDATLQMMSNATNNGTDFSVLHRIIWPDGSIHWISGSGRVVHDEHGQPLRSVGVSIDITERRNLEEQYQQAQKMEAIGRLAGGIAHDFNNLLTAILGYCELLMAALPAGDVHRTDLQEIQKAGTRASGLTQQLLAFSRREIIAPTLLNLNTVVLEMESMLQRLIGEDVSVELHMHGNLSLVKADRGQVEQIVMNLAVNARDAMPKGGRLSIETANIELDELYQKSHFDAKPGSYVALIVSDSGTGMTSEVRARLFEPFFTTKEVGRGTGLGLATVHGIVKQTGGTVNVYSEVGKGTSIKVYFPMVTGTATVAEPVTASPPHSSSEAVLVVEDEAGLRELIPRLLRRQGYTVHVAENADAAQQLFNTYQIDVLLTDVVMPGASGPELTARLQTQRPGLKVLYMSGYTEDAIVHHGVLDPDIAFLHKPFTSDSLSRKLREVLDC
ncbi:MAG: PAS domain-containing protein, partial [Gemmatimonadaceae bacterium]